MALVKNYQSFFINREQKKIRYKGYSDDSRLIDGFFLEYLSSFNIPVLPAVKSSSEQIDEQQIVNLPVKIKVSNFISPDIASFVKVTSWQPYKIPVTEYIISQDKRHIALTQNHIIGMQILTAEELKYLNRIVSKINAVLKAFFDRRELVVFSFICFFCRFEGKIYLSGEFIPQHLRVLTKATLETPVIQKFSFADAAQLRQYVELLLASIRS